MPITKYKRHNAVIIIEALTMGLEIFIANRVYCLDDNNELCSRAYGPNEEKKWLKVGFGGTTIAHLIDWSSRMSDREIISLQADMALNKMRMEKR